MSIQTFLQEYRDIQSQQRKIHISQLIKYYQPYEEAVNMTHMRRKIKCGRSRILEKMLQLENRYISPVITVLNTFTQLSINKEGIKSSKLNLKNKLFLLFKK